MDLQKLSYYVYRFLGAVMPHVPPRFGYAVFDQIGQLSYEKSTASRDAVLDNMRHVLRTDGDSTQVISLARQVFRNQARNYFDLFRVARLSDEEIAHLVQVYGLENIDQARAAGRGVIMFTAHFGNLDLVAQMFALNKYPVTAVAEHLRPEELFRYVVSLRASRGLRLVPADQFLRPLFTALHNNEIVAIAADRNLTGTGTVVDFFGEPALLPDGHVRLARRTGALLLPAFGLRNSDNTFEAVAEPAFGVDRSDDEVADLHKAMARLVGVLEKHIGAHPEQWVMFQHIWQQPGAGAVTE